MAKPSGILAILGKGDPKEEGDDAEAAPESADGNVGERASQDAIEAIKAGDAAALYEAMERIVAACHDAGEME